MEFSPLTLITIINFSVEKEIKDTTYAVQKLVDYILEAMTINNM
jgi:hypothetical protein